MSDCVNITGWYKIRKKMLERDNYVCRICAHGAGSLHVHHIDYSRANNEDDNLVTLCEPCHRGVHAEGYKPCDHMDWPVPWGEHPTESEMFVQEEPCYHNFVPESDGRMCCMECGQYEPE